MYISFITKQLFMRYTEFYIIFTCIDKEAIVYQIENLGNFLRNSSHQLKPNILMMKVLSQILERRCDIADFTGED